MKVETAHNMHNRVGVFLEVSFGGDQDTHAEAAVHGGGSDFMCFSMVFFHIRPCLWSMWKTCHYPV